MSILQPPQGSVYKFSIQVLKKYNDKWLSWSNNNLKCIWILCHNTTLICIWKTILELIKVQTFYLGLEQSTVHLGVYEFLALLHTSHPHGLQTENCIISPVLERYLSLFLLTKNERLTSFVRRWNPKRNEVSEAVWRHSGRRQRIQCLSNMCRVLSGHLGTEVGASPQVYHCATVTHLEGKKYRN